MRPVTADALAPFRAALDAAGESDRATFARRARNAAARAVVAASLADAAVSAPDHAAPADVVRAHAGAALGDELLALYEGGPDWTSKAIDVLEPLHALARA